VPVLADLATGWGKIEDLELIEFQILYFPPSIFHPHEIPNEELWRHVGGLG